MTFVTFPKDMLPCNGTKTPRNELSPCRLRVGINDDRFCPVKIRPKCVDHIKWINLHEDEPTVRAFIKGTIANEIATKQDNIFSLSLQITDAAEDP